MNDANRPFARQQTLLDDAAPTLEVIVTLRLNQPVRFLGMRGNGIDINWLDIHPDSKLVMLCQAVESLLSLVLNVSTETIVTRQHLVIDSERMGFPALSISLLSQEESTNRVSAASAAISLLAQLSFSDVHTAGSDVDDISPVEINHHQAIAKQVREKYIAGFGNTPLTSVVEIELQNGKITCGGRFLGITPEVVSTTEIKKITGLLVEWNARNRCFAVKHGNEKPEWIFYDADDDPWRSLRDLLGERTSVQVGARQTLRKLKAGKEEVILTFENFALAQEELFSDAA